MFGIYGYRQHSEPRDEERSSEADENFVPASATSEEEADLVLRAFEGARRRRR
ncbi:MAG: hypothetical protein U5Q44_03095 [Dehalococcoidia bacterium]|nr:hypothetical protein [Dehalococcoidia bacterium]